MKLSETFNVETELADEDGLFIDVAGYGVVHLGVFLDHLAVGVYASRGSALPKAEMQVPHSTFGGDQTPKLVHVRTTTNPLNILSGIVSPSVMLETAVRIIDKAQQVYSMDGVTWPRKYELIHDVLQTAARLRDLGVNLPQCFDKDYFGTGDPKVSLEIVLGMLQEKRNDLVRSLTRYDQFAASAMEKT